MKLLDISESMLKERPILKRVWEAVQEIPSPKITHDAVSAIGTGADKSSLFALDSNRLVLSKYFPNNTDKSTDWFLLSAHTFSFE